MIIDGRKIASDILERLSTQPKPEKFFAAVMVGDDTGSLSFLNQKEKFAKKLGVDFRLYWFPATKTKEFLCDEIKKIGDDAQCGGIILQLPLPNRADEQALLNMIPSGKDVDVLGDAMFAMFSVGESTILPPAVGVVQEILAARHSPLATSSVAIIGAGRLIGQPIAIWLRNKVKDVITLDKGDDLMRIKNADVVICGAGVPGLITPDILKDGATVIDFGYGTRDGKVMGDFDPSGVGNFSYTPTPGGTGPIDVAKLFENFYLLNRAH